MATPHPYGWITAIAKEGETSGDRQFPLRKKEYRFGRDPTGEVIVRQEGVAYTQCRVVCGDDDDVWLINGAPSGTRLNGEPMKMIDTHRFADGDYFAVADRRFHFHTHPKETKQGQKSRQT